MGFHDQMIDGAPWRSFTLARGDLRITTADRQIEREALNMSILLAASVPVGVALLGCLCLLWLGIGQGSAPLNRMRDALMRRSPIRSSPCRSSLCPANCNPCWIRRISCSSESARPSSASAD
jgi:hypothetical protein